MKKYLTIFILALVVIACSNDDNADESTSIEVSVIAQESLYGAGEEGIEQQNLVITDTATWEALLTQLNTVNDVTSGFTETEIDFSRYTIIAVFDEIKPNGGYLIDLEITAESERALVEIVSVFPTADASTIITQPFQIVKISKTALPIVFE